MTSFDVPPIPPYGAPTLDGAVPPIPEGCIGWWYAPGGRLAPIHLAPYWRRAAAGLVDYGLEFWLWPNLAIGVLGFGTTVTTWLVWLLVFLNHVVLQGNNGQTLGKGLFLIKLAYPVIDDDGAVLARASRWRCAGRQCLHFLDCMLLIGFLRPLVQGRRQTFADSLTKVVVIHEPDLELVEAKGRPVL